VYEPRTYRERMLAKGLVSFHVVIKETDLHVSARSLLREETEKAVKKYRKDLEDFIEKQPLFVTTLKPFDVPETAPDIVRHMAEVTKQVDVGPMASVAGVIAEYVGKELLKFTAEVIVENGGDIFIHTVRPRRIAIFAGESPLSNKVGLEVLPEQSPLGVCTSAGTVGHSLSLGSADAVVVVSKDTALADAAATAIGNRVHKAEDIKKVLAFGRTINDIMGVVIVKGDQIGAWGEIELLRM